ncbi:MAG: hypothetical protein JXA79_00190 [Deltaproteobacteria bacterium]|nr:hypothetical protein [Deltaproteobacteria bacterium]
MKWTIFRATKKTVPKEGIDIIIDKIERFAPKMYLPEREMYYYHYRQLRQYVKPLVSLLTYISEGTIKNENYDEFEKNLFLKLKNFYDVNGRLSIKESLNDTSLTRKYIELFKIFYNDGNKTVSNILECFKKRDIE